MNSTALFLCSLILVSTSSSAKGCFCDEDLDWIFLGICDYFCDDCSCESEEETSSTTDMTTTTMGSETTTGSEGSSSSGNGESPSESTTPSTMTTSAPSTTAPPA